MSDSPRERTINSHLQGSEEQGRGLSSYSYNPGHIWGPQNCSPLSDLPAFGLDGDSDSPLSECGLLSVGDCTLPLAGLRGSVSQGDRCFAGPFSKDVETDVRKAEENELSASEPDVNEGIVFNEVGLTLNSGGGSLLLIYMITMMLNKMLVPLVVGVLWNHTCCFPVPH